MLAIETFWRRMAGCTATYICNRVMAGEKECAVKLKKKRVAPSEEQSRPQRKRLDWDGDVALPQSSYNVGNPVDTVEAAHVMR